MSLKNFHVFFIILSVITAIGFGLWCMKVPYLSQGGSFGYLLLGVFSTLSGLALLVYLVRFLKKMRQLKTLLLLIVSGGLLWIPEAVWACPICMRNITGSQAEAINSGILTLLFCILFILICFAAFFIYLVTKNKKEFKSCR